MKFKAVNLLKRRRKICQLAGVKWPPNCHRHSFCSYALELYGAQATARAANHSEATLFKHYANKVSPADARAFAALRPL